MASQFALPRGVLGRAAGRVMAWENAGINRYVVELLEIRNRDRVLEIGCGPGVGLAAALERTPTVTAVDPSKVMVAQARKRTRGRARVEVAVAEAPPFDGASFDRVFAVNSLQHWDCRRDAIDELARVLAPGGRFVLAFRKQRHGSRDPHSRGATDEQVELLLQLLRDSGLLGVEAREREFPRETLVTVHGSRS